MKNLLFIVVDCARSEKTIIDIPGASPFTRRSARLSFLDEMRKKGTTWTGLHAVSSTTTPNFASMFTGLLPHEHGIREHSRHTLKGDVTTAAEVLKYHGYHNYMECTGPLIPEAGLSRGFDLYRCRERSEYLHSGFREHLEDLLPSLQEPWFLCLHLWEAHMPYQNPPPFNSEDYGRTSYDRALSLVDHQLGEILKGFDFSSTSLIYTSDHGERLAADYQLNQALKGGEMPVLQAWLKFQTNRRSHIDYDAWFAAARRAIGEVQARIYAHNVMGHGFHLTEEQIRVPLVIVDEERCSPGTLSSDLRSQRDLCSTLLDLAQVPDWEQVFPERPSLLTPSGEDRIYIEANGSGGKKYAARCYLRGARSRQWKYWRIEAEGMEHRVLWDLKQDPRETVNVAAEHPDVVTEMNGFLDSCLDTVAVHAGETADFASRDLIERKMRELGYL